MARTDHRILFTALGFLAVIIRGDVQGDKQALRATTIAKLIESFCQTSLPEFFASEPLSDSLGTSAAEISSLLENYIAELHTNTAPSLAQDRQTLLQMYELLLIQKARHEQEAFYLLAPDEVIANRILELAHEQIQREA